MKPVNRHKLIGIVMILAPLVTAGLISETLTRLIYHHSYFGFNKDFKYLWILVVWPICGYFFGKLYRYLLRRHN